MKSKELVAGDAQYLFIPDVSSYSNNQTTKLITFDDVFHFPAALPGSSFDAPRVASIGIDHTASFHHPSPSFTDCLLWDATCTTSQLQP